MDGYKNGTQRGTSNDNCLFIDVWSAQFGWLEERRRSEYQRGRRNDGGEWNRYTETFSGGRGTGRGRKFNFERGIWTGRGEMVFPYMWRTHKQRRKKKRNKNININKRKKTNSLNPAPWEVTRHTLVCAFLSFSSFGCQETKKMSRHFLLLYVQHTVLLLACLL